jgi:hypothetical protein
MSELSVGQLKGLLANDNVITVPSGHTIYAPGSVVQVLSITKTDTTTISTTSYQDIPGLSLTITPKSVNSKIFILATISLSSNTSSGSWTGWHMRVLRNGSVFVEGPSGTLQQRGWAGGLDLDTSVHGPRQPTTNSAIDSPASTSPQTYTVQAAHTAYYSGYVIVNGAVTQSTSYSGSGISTLTLMEIAQ